jgi:PPP family 3-phenylpropionic acid transporter
MVNDFFAIYLVSLDAPSSLVGSAFAISALVEIPTLLVFPMLSQRLGLSRIMVLGAVLILVRIGVLIVSSDALIATATMVLNGIGYALLLVGGITYVATLAPPTRAATAQGVFIGVAAGLASAVGPALAGIVAGATSLQTMFVLAGVISAVGLVALALAVSSRRFAPPPANERADVATAA